MMRVKKSVCCILSAFFLIPFISSCSGRVRPDTLVPDKHTSSNTTSSDEYEKEELTKDEITLVVWDSGNSVDSWIKQAGKKFNEIYPNIHIEYYEADFSSTPELLISGEYNLPRPDLFASSHDFLPRMADAEIILPTKNYEEITNTTLSAVYSPLFYKDVMYGYPVARETYALFYNTALLHPDDVPKTWEEMQVFAESIPKLFPNKYGFLFPCNSIFYLSSFLSEHYNQLLPEKGETGLLTTEALNGVELIRSFLPYFPDGALNLTLTDYENLFLNNEAAIIIGGSWLIPKAKQSSVSFGIAPLPSFSEDGSRSLALSGTRGMFVHSESEHPDEAAAFAKFLTTKEMQKLRLDLTSSLPAANLNINNGLTISFLDQLEFSYALPCIEELERLWDYNSQFCADVCNDVDAKDALAKYDHYIKTGSTEGYSPFPSTDTPAETEPTESVIAE